MICTYIFIFLLDLINQKENPLVFRMHLHNIERGKSGHPDYVNKFGFHVWTSCGSIPQKNAWKDDWKVKYYNFPVQYGTLKVSYFRLKIVTLFMVQTVVSHCLGMSYYVKKFWGLNRWQ